MIFNVGDKLEYSLAYSWTLAPMIWTIQAIYLDKQSLQVINHRGQVGYVFIDPILKEIELGFVRHIITKLTHQHNFINYVGFTDTYDYCKDCGKKKL